MSKFLKLTNIIINKNVIQHIDINKDNYVIHLMSNKFSGFFLFSVGWNDSHNTDIKVCKIKDVNDYKIVSNWIDNELK